MIEKEINSVQDLIAELDTDNAGYGGVVWYRGQSNKSWGLLPGYTRLDNPKSESTLIKMFKQSASMLVQKTPTQSFDWLFLMQHYGVPTRLLDWSESPLVALYFAVADKDETTDAALWSLRPSKLNNNAGINNTEEEDFIPSFDDVELSNYTIENLAQNTRTRLMPLATIATRNNPRIQAQLGVFTIHHLDNIPIERIGDTSHVVKYLIPSSRKSEFAKQLSLLGFTRFQLFPELASIGSIIKGELL